MMTQHLIEKMTDTTHKDLQNTKIHEVPRAEATPKTSDREQAEEHRTTTDSFRQAGYVVLFIAAVFVINAMETGSYRTPWPVALGTTLVGLGLLGYSWYLHSRSNS